MVSDELAAIVAAAFFALLIIYRDSEMTCAQITMTAGLVLNMLGVLGLFFFGMPFTIRTGGAIILAVDETNEKAAQQEKLYDVLAWCSLALVLLGTVFQVVGTNT